MSDIWVSEQATTDAQRRAAAPDRSAWAAASAGTGKTKVLVDRVLRLLLAGSPPQRLLCLTFTKAAAKQMANRLAEVLRDWTTMPEEGVARSLLALTGNAADRDQLIRARRLFAQVLDAPGGLRIDTIHAFCQSLLRRFPIEARLPPNFQVLDDRSAAELLQSCREAMLAQARTDAGGELAEALGVLTTRTGELGFDALVAELIRERGRLRRLLPDSQRGIRQAVQRLYRRLQLDPADSEESLTAAACDDAAFALERLRRAAAALINGPVTDRKRGEALAAWLANPAERAQGFQLYWRAYFTLEGERAKRLVTKETMLAAPGIEEVLATEAARLERVIEKCNAARNAAGTTVLLRLAADLEARFARAKKDRAVLDYDDLILATSELLSRPGIAPWVLYKLDGGIDHVLIDEAQDTNPEQWQVIAALAGEFFSGEGARASERTVFAVGDVKQSIYSFQRADPQAFVDMRDRFAGAAQCAGQRWPHEGRIEWFRSTAAVLGAVDAVFAREEAWKGVALDGAPIRHRTVRSGEGGLVELWPPVAPREREPLSPWALPVERVEEDSPPARLARLIASRVAEWRRSERLESKGRLVQARDVMILVRRRNALVELIVRELKKAGVPVAGVDRMVLADQLAVMDMIALGRFLLLPDDDLTLATVLKGPLFSFSEERLFELAHGRGEKGLWSELRRRSAENPDFTRAETELSELLARVDYVRPYDLFAELLGRRGGRRRIVARLGIEANDPLDEFLAAALAFERAHAPALETFLHWLEAGREEIKRDLEAHARDEVRVMTVHGAKGLQAPIVILPDTLQVPTHGAKLLWLPGTETDPELSLWSPDSKRDDASARSARAAFREAQRAEYRRLLYVAMTRAEDRLYVCGYEDRRTPPEDCWYHLVRTGLAAAPGVERAEFADFGGVGLRLRSPQLRAVKDERLALVPPPEKPLPAWWNTRPPDEPEPPRPLVPSQPDGEAPPVRAPFDADDDTRRFRRGRLIHRLLQTLPDLPEGERDDAAARFLARSAHRLDAATQAEIRRETLSILANAEWSPLFGPGSVAEASIVGRVGSRTLSGQIDRLLVTGREVTIIDYKTNRPPPLTAEDTPPIYIRQMAAYWAALAAIYPAHRIRCALLWTDAPRLLELPEALLVRYAP